MSVNLNEISRRNLLRTVGLSVLVLPLMRAKCQAQSAEAAGLRFNSISIDTQPLADKGLSNYAARVAKAAQPIVESVFADRLSPNQKNAPRLVLRIDSIELSSGSNSGTGVGFSPSGSPDWISGAGEIVDASGHVVSVKPVETSLPAYGTNTYDVVADETLRTQRLILTIAQWIKRDT